MATKKISLNELKSLIGKIIKEEIQIIKEESETSIFDKYVNAVKNELDRLESGFTIIKVINQDFTGNAEKYEQSKWNDIKNTYIKKNFEKGIKPELTAQYLRDSWYGV
jgi:hypothetical protein